MNKNIEDTEYVEYIEYIEYIEYNESATVPQTGIYSHGRHS